MIKNQSLTEKPASILFFALFLCALPLAQAEEGKPCPEKGPGMTLVVSASGGADYRRIQDALNAARPGDTVRVRAGKYQGGISFPKSGAAGACIRLEGEPGAEISGGSRGITIASKNYISVKGLTISDIRGGDTPTGIAVTGSASHIELKGNTVRRVTSNQNAHGISFYGSSSQPMRNLLIDGNTVRDCKLGQSEALVLNGNVEGFVISNNKVHDNDNIGIDIIGHEGTAPAGKDFARKGSIVNNSVWNNSSGRNPTYGGERSAGGIYVDGGQGIRIEGNTVSKCDIGIEVASEHGGKSTAGIIVRNNKLSESHQGNIMMGGYDSRRGRAENILVEGNTLEKGNTAEIILQHYNNGVTIKGNSFRPRPGRKNVVATGGGNKNIVIQGNRYAVKPGPGDMAQKDGQMTMLHEEAIARGPQSNSPGRSSWGRLPSQ